MVVHTGSQQEQQEDCAVFATDLNQPDQAVALALALRTLLVLPPALDVVSLQEILSELFRFLKS